MRSCSSDTARCVLITGVQRAMGGTLVSGFEKLGADLTLAGAGEGGGALGEREVRWIDESGESYFELYDAFVESCGGPGALIVNLMGRMGVETGYLTSELDEQDGGIMVDRNLKHLVDMVQALVAVTVERKSRVVMLNLADNWGLSAEGMVSPYSGTGSLENVAHALEHVGPGLKAHIAVKPDGLMRGAPLAVMGNSLASVPVMGQWVERAGGWMMGLKPPALGVAVTLV